MAVINKERYTGTLRQLLTEHYDNIRKNIAVKERQDYIDGYLTAARALDAFDYQELKEIIDNTHIAVFGKTVEERRRVEVSKPDDDSLDIPTYIRKGIALEP